MSASGPSGPLVFITNDVSYHTFSLRFQSCKLLFDISHYLTLALQAMHVRILVVNVE